MSNDEAGKPAAEKSGLLTPPTVWWIALAVAVVVIGGGAAAYFLLPSGTGSTARTQAVKVAHTGDAGLVSGANEAAARETGGLCERATTRAQSFAVIPDGSKASGSETETEVKGRFTCQAQSLTGTTFTLVVRQTCDDLGNYQCIALKRVTGPDGSVLYVTADGT
jgi:hypothetical protein